MIAIELQGHGRTADTDRPLSLERLADDAAEVLTQIGVERTDLLGFSLGGLVAVEFARHTSGCSTRPTSSDRSSPASSTDRKRTSN